MRRPSRPATDPQGAQTTSFADSQTTPQSQKSRTRSVGALVDALGHTLQTLAILPTLLLTCRVRKNPPGIVTAFALLLTARLISAGVNIVHDCDEVYNYWEPLHFLLYGYGMQTWEYRCCVTALPCLPSLRTWGLVSTSGLLCAVLSLG